MQVYLELFVDKFIFKVATDRLYTSEGVWGKVEGDHIRVGLADFPQQHSGDVAFAETRPVGEHLAAGDEFASIETVKVTIRLGSPIAGEIIETNPVLITAPEMINQDPYGEGWLVKIKAVDWETDRTRLLEAQAYFGLMKQQAEDASK